MLAVSVIGKVDAAGPAVRDVRVWLAAPSGVLALPGPLSLEPVFEGASEPFTLAFRVLETERLHEVWVEAEANVTSHGRSVNHRLRFFVLQEEDGDVRFYPYCEPPTCQEWRFGQGLKFVVAGGLGFLGFGTAAGVRRVRRWAHRVHR